MDSTDIDTDALNKIFIKPQQFTSKHVEPILDWNQTFDPSFSMVKNQIKKFFNQNESYPALAVQVVLKTLNMLVEAKCPKNFLRAYLANVKIILQGPQTKGKEMITSKLEYYLQNWKNVPLEILEPYFDAFNLKKKVSQEEINLFIEELIEKKKYNNCLGFIKFLGVGQNHKNIEKLVGKMSNKKNASKAADYVKNLKLNPNDYPALGERLYKNTARHFLTKEGWEYAEQIFENYPEALTCVIEDLIYKKKFKQALSIWSRHPLEQHLQKEESKIFFKENQKPSKQNILQNPLFKDYFGPSNPQKYFSLSEFGLTEKNIVWVDNQTKQLDKIMKKIAESPLLGIDTESIVGQTKFNTSTNAALIQIATETEIYLFDGFKTDHELIRQYIAKIMEKAIIIGHSFTNDTECMALSFGFKNQDDLKIRNLIDLHKVYKNIFPQTRYSSLAHICKSILGKQICKQQTLTNWKRRPLRANQTHYGALDAYILIQIYKKLLKEYGQLMEYYAEVENDSF